jgi:hypothetical protein
MCRMSGVSLTYSVNQFTASMHEAYELSYRDAVLLWDAILDLEPVANPQVDALPSPAGKTDQGDTIMDPLIEDPFEREMAAIAALLDEAEASLPVQPDA